MMLRNILAEAEQELPYHPTISQSKAIALLAQVCLMLHDHYKFTTEELIAYGIDYPYTPGRVDYNLAAIVLHKVVALGVPGPALHTLGTLIEASSAHIEHAYDAKPKDFECAGVFDPSPVFVPDPSPRAEKKNRELQVKRSQLRACAMFFAASLHESNEAFVKFKALFYQLYDNSISMNALIKITIIPALLTTKDIMDDLHYLLVNNKDYIIKILSKNKHVFLAYGSKLISNENALGMIINCRRESRIQCEPNQTRSSQNLCKIFEIPLPKKSFFPSPHLSVFKRSSSMEDKELEEKTPEKNSP